MCLGSPEGVNRGVQAGMIKQGGHRPLVFLTLRVPSSRRSTQKAREDICVLDGGAGHIVRCMPAGAGDRDGPALEPVNLIKRQPSRERALDVCAYAGLQYATQLLKGP